ncbi:MAG: SDR family NAD(P)-dependent oxidoreductase [Gemmataceae bacterium]|nr:SDR family NAD(P)-dependent oxidoreductase [Gemmataceae bacterium]
MPEERNDPIAIVGIGCRFPGDANGPAAFWKLLALGVDAVGEVPPNRWNPDVWYSPDPTVPGRIYSRAAGCVRGIDQFDAGFFGIAPREAAEIDPQQRMLLEVAWEALEDAGVVPGSLAGSLTSVYTGIYTQEYGETASLNPVALSSHSSTGRSPAMGSNRLSYYFDLRGPSVSVDAACASSLVALHLACESLWQRESQLALVAGANVLIRPESSVGFCKASMLSRRGRCLTFDARCDGYVRAEGVGVVVLKPLARAQADGDRVYAVIRATATNQDGRTPGISYPNQQAQAALVREALRRAGLAPDQVQYVEAHGTGTPVGDPIECAALGEVLSAGRDSAHPCRIGSVKTNIGHLEGAAGMAGLIKLALMLHHQTLPPHIHFEQPNPAIDFSGLKLQVQTVLEPWPNDRGVRIGGVSSYGFGGTNAHAILQECAPAVAPPAPPPAEDAELLVLSAQTPGALRDLAESYRVRLAAGSHVHVTDLCRTAATRRAHLEHRLAIAGRSADELADRLRAFRSGEQSSSVSVGRCTPGASPRVAFVYCGNGPQWWGMGRQLMAREPTVRSAVERCDQAFRRWASWSLLEEMAAGPDHSRMDRTDIAQPALFAIQFALTELFRAWGIQPAAVVGHSAGEAAAALAAGAISFEDAIRIVFHRSRSHEARRGLGGMAAAGLSVHDAEGLLAPYGGKVTLAAVNSPRSVTLLGDVAVLGELEPLLLARQVFFRRLSQEYAFHGPVMAPVRSELLRALDGIGPCGKPVCRFVSTVTGADVNGTGLGPSHWADNACQPVLFGPAVQRLIDDEIPIFLEIGPHPVLSAYIAELLNAVGRRALSVSSLRRKEDEWAAALHAVGRMHVAGVPLRWDRVYPRGPHVDLPTYPWQHERYWHRAFAPKASDRLDPVHPLLGAKLELAHPTWEGELDLRIQNYLADHRIDGSPLFPIAGYMEMGLAAAQRLFGPSPWLLEALEVHAPLPLEQAQAVIIQTTVSPVDQTFRVHTRLRDGDKPWTLQASGKLGKPLSDQCSRRIDLEALSSRLTEPIPANLLYAVYGYGFGPDFQAIEWIRMGECEALAKVILPPALTGQRQSYHFHPSLLDGCLQCLGTIIREGARQRGQPHVTFLPVSIERFHYLGVGDGPVYVHGVLVEQSPGRLVLNATLVDESGATIGVIEGVCQQATHIGSAAADENLMYHVEWIPRPRPADHAVPWHAGDLPSPRSLVEHLSRRTASCHRQVHGPLPAETFRSQSELLAESYVWQAIQQLLPAGAAISIERLLGEGGVELQFGPLLKRWLGFIGAASAQKLADPDRLWRQLVHDLPAYHAELQLMGRCGRRLCDVLCGRVEPRELIFPMHAPATAEHLFDSGPTFQRLNALCADALAALVDRLPAGRPLRVLEVGAGSGGATGWMLRQLPPDRVRYAVTDNSEFLLAQARERFAAYPFVEYRTLDIQRDPLESGFGDGDFDVIVAANVFHETQCLPDTLRIVRQLLASEGILFLVELAAPGPRWMDITFGLLPEWNRFGDDRLRANHPLLSRPAWVSLLRECGFSDIASITDDDATYPEQWLYLARGPRIDRSLGSSGVTSLQVDDGIDQAPADPSANGTPTVQTDWLLFVDQGGLGRELAERLKSDGVQTTAIVRGPRCGRFGAGDMQLNPAEPSGFRQLLEHIGGDASRALEVVFLWGLNVTSADDFASINKSCGDVLSLCQALEQAPAHSRRLWLITAGAETISADEATSNPGQAPLWGLGRVIRSELSNLACHLIDLSARGMTHPDPWEAELAALLTELRAPDNETELLIRGSERLVPRLRPLSLEAPRPFGNLKDDQKSVGYCLEIPPRKGLGQLRLRQTACPTPQSGQVVIDIKAAGLNFRDVLLAMGMIAPEVYESAGEGIGLGVECAGVIREVGPQVSDWHAGDEVFVLMSHSIGRFALVPTERVFRKPAEMSFEDAATVLSVFVTAYYALKELGRVEPGERVLIHGAAGGVGLAAIQVVRHLGGEVWATAGSPEKREYLRALGIEHVFDSRSLAFVDEIQEACGGQGMDVILNSLAGETMVRSLSLLRPFGRFLELGKRDYLEGRPVSLRPFLDNLAYHSVDLDQLMIRKPGVVRRLVAELLALFAKRALSPLPHRVFPIGDVAAAFQHMQRSRHIGKVVIATDPDPRLPLLPPRLAPFRIPAGSTYLVAGGLSGFGLACAGVLVDAGARHLVLTGRRGVETPGAAGAVAELEQRGVTVLVAAVDVTDAGALESLLNRVRRELPPLKGVVHSAAVLEDASLLRLDRQMMERVLAPKVRGAWNLHRLTLNDPLDHFILFSSISALAGNPGQANYAAGNAFLDALAQYRRQRSLPALSVNWGAIGQVGLVARHKELGERLARGGARLLAPTQAFRILERVLQTGLARLAVMDLDPGKLTLNPAYARSPLWSELREPATMESGEGTVYADFREVLEKTPNPDRAALIQSRLADHVAKALGTTVERLDLEKSLTLLGLDSLMAVELRIRIERDMAWDVPVTVLMQGPSVLQLAREFRGRLGTHAKSE